MFGQISLQLSPRQETFWVSSGFESTEESVTLSDAPRLGTCLKGDVYLQEHLYHPAKNGKRAGGYIHDRIDNVRKTRKKKYFIKKLKIPNEQEDYGEIEGK